MRTLTTTNHDLHPVTQILLWSVLVVSVQRLALHGVLIVLLVVIIWALLTSRYKLLQLLRRTRWVMISLILVYGYSTAGRGVVAEWGVFSPTIEGLSDGLLQLSRLLVALAGLAVLLQRLSRLQLIAGLYSLFTPLQYIGVSRERWAVRLALTLHYAEVAMLRSRNSWQETLVGLFEPPDTTCQQQELVLPIYHFRWQDVLLFVVMLLVLWWII